MAAVFVYLRDVCVQHICMCMCMCHTRIIAAPQDLQQRPREPKQLKLNILKGHGKRVDSWKGGGVHKRGRGGK